MKLSLLTSHASICNTTMVGFESGDTVERGCLTAAICTTTLVLHRILWYRVVLDITLTQSSSTHCQYYISEVLEPIVLSYLQGLVTFIFQQDNARTPVVRLAQRFFVNHQIQLLPLAAHSPDLSPIENMWCMVAERLTQITLPAATPNQLRQCVEAAWSAVPQEHIQSLFE
ncbi:transposable element Tcb1 transposase [Trichonephila clavipes]|nr:transposable element Tcb1 transposase [Trichonephila clavipes]